MNKVRNNKMATAIEYGLIAALISVALITGAQTLFGEEQESKTTERFNQIESDRTLLIQNTIQGLKDSNPEAGKCVEAFYIADNEKNPSLKAGTILIRAMGSCLTKGYASGPA